MSPTRRRFMQAAALAGAGGACLSACGSSSASISSDPSELVMWYWNRSAAPGLLETAAEAIPDTDFHVRADLIGTNFDTKLRTSLAGGAYIPDVTWINSNNSLYYRNENQFVDMNELGAADLKDDYYEWKWNLGNTPEGRFCFFPLDIGPTGFYFRADIFDEAGLPSDPDEMSSAIDTWEKFFEVGEELKEQSGATMLSTASTVYDAILNASPDRYFDENDQPIFEVDGNSVRTAWDTAVAAIEAGVVSSLQTDSDKNAAWTSGKCAGNISAAWWAQILEEAAPDTSGNWRIADQPVRAGNNGGSFAAIPHTCKDPEATFAFITWINSPENQAKAYNEVQLFPSAPEAYASGTMEYGGEFFGDQDPLEFFSHAAETVPSSFISTWESVASGNFGLQIQNVQTSGKDPDQAWADAIEATNKVLKKRGVIQ